MIINVNFGTESSSLPSDEFILDFGSGYNVNRGFGWITEASIDDSNPIPIDISTNTRDRDLIDEQSTDTLIHLQYPDGLTGTRPARSNQTPSAWEYDLENGTYQITVSVGDPEFTDSNHVINLEGESVISGFVPTEDELFTEVTTTVEVTDGRLTLDAIGGENTKLNFIEIVPEDLIESDSNDSDIDEDTAPEATIPDTTDTEEDTDTTTDSTDTDGDEGEGDTDAPTDSTDTDVDDGDEGDTEGEGDTDAPTDSTDTDVDDGGEDDTDGEGDTDTTTDSTDTDVDGEEDTDAPTDSTDDADTGDGEGDTDTTTDSVDADTDGDEGDTTTTDSTDADIGDGEGDTDAPTDSTDDADTDGDEGDTTTTDSTDDADTGDGEGDTDAPTDSADADTDGGEDDADGEEGDTIADSTDDADTGDGEEGEEGDTTTTDSTDADVDDGEGDTDTPTDSTDTEEEGDGGSTPDTVTSIDGEGDTETPEDPDGTGSDVPEDTDTSEDTGGEVGIPVEGGGVVETVEPISAGINFNFGVPRVDSPAGFTQDIGEAYDSERGFGWVTEDSAGSADFTPIDVVVNGRDRDTLFNDGLGGQFREPVRDSLIHMQYPTGLPNSSRSVTSPAAWEYEIADGQYEVTVGVGDPTFFDSNHVINVEGESLISGFTPTGFDVNGFLPLDAQAFSQGSSIVEVTDGSLTVDAIGGENTKINFISIVPVDAS